MAFLTSLPSACPSAPNPRPFPSGRYTNTNPLRREAGLRLVGESLPEPLRWSLLRAWRNPDFPTDKPVPQGLQSVQGQRPNEASLAYKPPNLLGYMALVQLELSRRLVEASQTSIWPVARNAMLSAQSLYLRQLYDALTQQIGEIAALTEFELLIASIR